MMSLKIKQVIAIESYSYLIVLKSSKSQHFICFYIKILFQSASSYKAKRNTLFCYENIQLIGSKHSPDIEYNNFIKLYKVYTKEPFSFLENDTTLPLNNPLRFRKKLL